MTGRVRITDVSPRDGLQNEPRVIPSSEKVRLVSSLLATGVDEVEVTSFVSPKWVPQLADAEDVLAGVREVMEGITGLRGWMPRAVHDSPMPVLSVLVPNEKGFDRALAIHASGLPLKIALFTAASETFASKNTNASIAETIERFRVFLPRAFEAGMHVRMYVSCAVACPFAGPIRPEAVRRVVDQLLALAPNDEERSRLDIDLGDTIGVAHPHEIEALLRAFEPRFRAEQITLHLHDTFNRASACVRAALDLGVRSFDGSAGGLGGCPYAGTPQRPAPGNIATELLVSTVHDAGYRTGVDPALLAESGAIARSIRAG